MLLVGLGKKEGYDRKRYKKALAVALAAVARTGARDAVSYLGLDAIAATDAYYRARLAAEAVGLSLYRVPAIRSKRDRSEPRAEGVRPSRFPTATTRRTPSAASPTASGSRRAWP